jgi:radical SAM protein with 4Fe4S-binding SPASM domain
MKGLWDFASGRGRALPCRAGRDFFFLDPGGDVYTCNAAPYRMGNLAEQEFDVLWSSPGAGDARTQADRCQAGCWMICTARTAIRRAWPRALAWAVWHKAFGVTFPRCP